MTPDATESGRQILRIAVGEAAAVLGDRLRAAYAIGSLAHGGFVPEVSDVDLALIVERADGAGNAAAIDAVRDNTVRRFASSAHRSLAGRLSIFWSDWRHLARGAAAGRFPATDRLDLLDSGTLLYGTDRRAGCARPTADDLLLDSVTFAATRFAEPAYLRTLHDPDGLARQGARPASKTVLFPVRLLYTAATGNLGRNDHAAAWYDGDGAEAPHAGELVAQAVRWRLAGLDDVPAAADLLRRELLPLYRSCAEHLGRRAAEAGHPEPAARLAALHAALTAGG